MPTSRTERARHFRKVFGLAMLVSVSAHAALLALEMPIRFSASSAIRWTAAAMQPAEPFEPEPVVPLTPPPVPLPVTEPNAGSAPPAELAAASEAAAAADAALGPGATVLPSDATPASAAQTFDPLVVVDPVGLQPIAPLDLVFPAAPAAEPAAAVAGAPQQAYVPGGIGSAKRRWAGGEGGEARPFGSGIGLVFGNGRGVCALPGRSGGVILR